MIKGIHHIAITTSDMDGLIDFYRQNFGGEILSSLAWEKGSEALDQRLGLSQSAGRLVMVGFGDMRIEFFQFDAPVEAERTDEFRVSQPGYTHVAFQVDDCQSEYDRLKAGGMRFHAAPLRMPSGASFAYGRDPDGNIVELIELPSEN